MAALMAMATPDMVDLDKAPSTALIELAGALFPENVPESRVSSVLSQSGNWESVEACRSLDHGVGINYADKSTRNYN